MVPSMDTEVKQKLRIIIQFQPAARCYTLIAHTETRSLRPLRFNSLEKLITRFADAGIPAERRPTPQCSPNQDTILYAQDLDLSQKQLAILGFKLLQ